jgi:5,10-methylene-tetrahydrofolate dehydrogenase/methenyl tetrahydrofolate cyclohydrolase
LISLKHHEDSVSTVKFVSEYKPAVNITVPYGVPALTSIEGRSVIVTGASRGIGKGIARVFAAKGARVLIAARDLVQAQAAAAEIRAAGG